MQTDFPDFQTFSGPAPNFPYAGMGNPIWDFPHMAAFTVTQLCTAYFVISSCYFISIKKPASSFNLIPTLKIAIKS